MKDKIVVIGMPGSGKTTIGKILAEELSMPFIDMDEYIEQTTCKSIAELFEQGEDYFRDIETNACRDLAKKSNIFISTGGGVVKRPINIEILKKNSMIVFIDRPIEKILEDVDVSSRPLLKDGKEKVRKLYEERYDLYKEGADEIIVNDSDINSVVDKFKVIVDCN